MRHLSRHLQATLQELVHAHLSTLHWIGPADTTPFGALPVAFYRKRPDEATLTSLQPNAVAVSFGSQTDDAEQELGAGLLQQDHVFFVDIYAENEGIGLALSEDVRDLFTGRAPATSRYVPLLDWTSSTPTPVPGYRMELGEIVRAPSDRVLAQMEWQVVSGTAFLSLPGIG